MSGDYTDEDWRPIQLPAEEEPSEPVLSPEDRIRALEAKCDLLSASLKQADALNVALAGKLTSLMSEVRQWTHTFGAALKPTGADSFGEGMRAAKSQVGAIVAKHEGKL